MFSTSYQILKPNLKLMISMCDSFDLLFFIFNISLNEHISWEGPDRLGPRTRENAMKIFKDSSWGQVFSAYGLVREKVLGEYETPTVALWAQMV